MFGKSAILAALAGLASSVGVSASPLSGAAPRYGHTIKSRNGGTPSGAAASKRAATKRRNMRARSTRK